jgi:hypothetical protein
MPEESPSRRIRKIRQESQRKLRDPRVQLGISLLKSKGVALPEAQTDRERIAQIEAYKNLIRDKTRELESWIQHRDCAAKQGMTKQAQFRQQMTTGMENQLERHKEGFGGYNPCPGQLGAVPPNLARPHAPSAIPLGVGEKSVTLKTPADRRRDGASL